MKKYGFIIAFLVCFLLAGCTAEEPVANVELIDLTGEITKSDLAPIEIGTPDYTAQNPKIGLTQFALQLCQEEFKEGNLLISPFSILSALGMTANGAAGDTLAQIEALFQTDTTSLNDYLMAYRQFLPQGDKYQINIANSIWFKDKESLTVQPSFLQRVKDYYGANVYKAPFDESTKNSINAWVKKETDGMIEQLLEEAPPADAVVYLINALSFDAEWEKIYEETQIRAGEFTTAAGEKQKVEFMNSHEYSYLETPTATGFLKPYAEGKYAFAALLPKENIEMADFLQSLDGESLQKLLAAPSDMEVIVRLPKFTVEYSTILNQSLQDLGMTTAFDSERADFSPLAHSDDGNIFISKVIHQAKIEVNERGTKAGAVTAVEMTDGAALMEPKQVVLDRPFFYMIIDTEQNFPLFMGCCMTVR